MDNFEIREILETFSVIADTREQNTGRASERFKAFGVPVQRATLSYGDYCANVIRDGVPLYDISSTLKPACVFERKMSLDELATCFTIGRNRFRREFERATEAGAKVYLLIENGSWEAILNHRYKSRLNPKAFEASLVAWSIRYGFAPLFCKSETSGKIIREFLYRDMKERLEHGELG